MVLCLVQSVKAAQVSDLQTAVNQEGNEISFDQAITVGANEDVTLDLKGKTLTLTQMIDICDGGKLTVTGNGKIVTSTVDAIFKVENGGQLQIVNGEFENTKVGTKVVWIIGTETDSGVKTKVNIQKDATLKSNCPISIGVKANNASYGIELDVSGKINAVTGNKAQSSGTIGINVNGKIKKTTGNVPVINIHSGAVITSEEGNTGNTNNDASVAVYAAGFAKFNIDGGSFQGTEALSIKSGILNITGGTFEATGAYTDPVVAWGSGTETTGSTISITSNTSYAGNIEVSISNATIKSKNGYAILEKLSNATSTFVKSLKVNSAKITAPKGVIVTDSNINYVATGSVEKKIDGVYVIGKENTITVPSKLTGGQVTASSASALPGETISLTVKTDKGYGLESIKVVDAAGKEITIKDNEFTMPNGNVEVKVSFKALEVKAELPTVDESKVVNITVPDAEKVENVLSASVKADSNLSGILDTSDVKVSIAVADITASKEVEQKVTEALNKKAENIQLSKFFDVTIVVKDNTDKEVGQLSELTDKVDLTVVLPEELQEVKEGFARTYYIVRDHDGEIEILDAKLSADGKTLEFASDKFSTYAIAYKDEEVQNTTNNPKTGDQIMMYVAILSIATAGIVTTRIKIKKLNKKH